jgi:hypothetical protein
MEHLDAIQRLQSENKRRRGVRLPAVCFINRLSQQDKETSK